MGTFNAFKMWSQTLVKNKKLHKMKYETKTTYLVFLKNPKIRKIMKHFPIQFHQASNSLSLKS